MRRPGSSAFSTGLLHRAITQCSDTTRPHTRRPARTYLGLRRIFLASLLARSLAYSRPWTRSAAAALRTTCRGGLFCRCSVARPTPGIASRILRSGDARAAARRWRRVRHPSARWRLFVSATLPRAESSRPALGKHSFGRHVDLAYRLTLVGENLDHRIEALRIACEVDHLSWIGGQVVELVLAPAEVNELQTRRLSVNEASTHVGKRPFRHVEVHVALGVGIVGLREVVGQTHAGELSGAGLRNRHQVEQRGYEVDRATFDRHAMSLQTGRANE